MSSGHFFHFLSLEKISPKQSIRCCGPTTWRTWGPSFFLHLFRVCFLVRDPPHCLTPRLKKTMAAWFNEDQRRKLEEFYNSWDGVYYGKNEERFQELMKTTGLSRLQVRGWLRNRRNRGVYKGRIVHSVLQVRGLEWIYKNYAEYPTSHLKKKVGLAISMDPEQVNKWFETRRRRGTPKAALRSEHDQNPEWLSLLSALRRVVIEDSNGVNHKAFRDLKKKKKEENSFVSHYRLNGGGCPTNAPIMTKIAPTMAPYQSQNSFHDDFRFIGSTLATSFAASLQESQAASPRAQIPLVGAVPSHDHVIPPTSSPITSTPPTLATFGVLHHHQQLSPPTMAASSPQFASLMAPSFPVLGPVIPRLPSSLALAPPASLDGPLPHATTSPHLQLQQVRASLSLPRTQLKQEDTKKHAIPAALQSPIVASSALAATPNGAESSHKYSIDFLCS